MPSPGIKIPVLAFAVGLAALASSARVAPEDAPAAHDPFLLDEIVVVANKDRRPLRDVAANVTILRRDDLSDALSTSLGDLFRYTPGVAAEVAGTRFGAESVSMRGISGNRVAILLDGVSLSDHFSIGSFSNATRDFVDAGLVERVELLHGPASALYGSSAIGGVIDMRTTQPWDVVRNGRYGGRLSVTAHGHDQSEHVAGLAAAQWDSVGILGGFSIRQGHESESAALMDVQDRKDWERRNALFNAVGDDPTGRAWQFGYKYQRADAQTDIRSPLGSGRFASTTALQGDDEYEMRMAHLRYELCASACWFDEASAQISYQQSLTEQRTLDERAAATRPVLIRRDFTFEQDIAGVELNATRQAYTGALAHRIGFGVEWSRHRTEELRNGSELGLEDGMLSSTVLGEVLPVRDFPNSKTTELAAYVEDTMSVGNWTLIGALRAERYALKPDADAVYRADNPVTDTVSIRESSVSPKFGLIYHAAPALEVFLQYAHGFRAPPFYDANIGLDIPLFGIRALPNPDLKSETSNGIDLGFRWRGERSRARLSLFHARYEDFIESKVRLGADPDTGVLLFQSQNLSKAVIRGLELSAEKHFAGTLNGLSLDVAAYLARGENRDNGEPLNSVGPAQAVLGVRWDAPSGDTSVRLLGSFAAGWNKRDETAGDLFQPAGYGIVDLYLERKLSRRTTLRAAVRNLGDRQYWAWSDTGGLAPDDPVLPTLARPGRNLSLQFNMAW